MFLEFSELLGYFLVIFSLYQICSQFPDAHHASRNQRERGGDRKRERGEEREREKEIFLYNVADGQFVILLKYCI